MNELVAPPPTRGFYILAAFGVVLIIATALILLKTFYGDPVIYLPYARAIAQGDFFSYNPHQFSSGSTSPLWAVLLSIPLVLGTGIAGAKIFSLLATIAAYLIVLRMLRVMVGAGTGSALASLFLVEMMTFFSVMMYESALVVALVALSIIAGERVVRRWEANGRADFRTLLPLILVWSALPLSRPDAVVLIPLELICLWWFGPIRNTRTALMLMAATLIAAIPSALYFGYSIATLGEFSVSSKCRAFALHESADKIGPILFSRKALAYIGGILYMVLVAAVGLDRFRNSREDNPAPITSRTWLMVYGGIAILLYAVLLVFVSPVTNDLARYFLPIAPFLVLGAAHTMRQWQGKRPKMWVATVSLLALLFILKPAASLLADAVTQSRQGYTFDEITEKELAAKIDSIAKPGESVLSYEVQDRWTIRPDIALLSLDGITDGRVAPYLSTADMTGFILKYRPNYWVANDAVHYRPYLKKSILRAVADTFDTNTELRDFDTSGIHFHLLDRRNRPMPEWFAGWQKLFGLTYATGK